MLKRLQYITQKYAGELVALTRRFFDSRGRAQRPIRPLQKEKRFPTIFFWISLTFKLVSTRKQQHYVFQSPSVCFCRVCSTPRVQWCEFIQTNTGCLGFVLKQGKQTQCKKNVDATFKAIVSNLKELQSFLRLENFFRHHIPKSSETPK